MNDGTSAVDVTPGIYQHFKGVRYRVIGSGRHSETHEIFVIYETMSPDNTQRWVRPYSMFFETVSIDGVDVPRFARVHEGDAT